MVRRSQTFGRQLLALRIPKDIQTALDLGEGSQVNIGLSRRGKLVITPSKSVRSQAVLKALEFVWA